MYPDPNQQQQNQPPATPVSPGDAPPQYSIDYLNQIAPKQQRSGLSSRLFVMITGGGVLIALIVGVLMLTSGGSGSTQTMQTFAARIQNLEKVTGDAQKNIKSNDLRASNSNLNIFFTNTDRDMTTPLKNNGVDIKKLDKTITDTEKATTATLTAKLEDARLNAVFDRTYPREMSYQLAAIESLMKSIYSSTSSKSLKSFLQTTDDSLIPLKKQFDNFNATSS
jgi:hypothetical protein